MINVDKINPTGIFTNYIYKAIPLAFDESMSYYETLCSLLSYLKDTVIPAVNNNAGAVIELQNAYTDLKNYVDHYFDNLDVQSEINNKLDKMVEDGTFESLISFYINPFLSNLNNIVENQNTQIQTINNKVNAIENINPIPVDNISDMTDTTKIYVLTTSGYWYYYNSTSEEWTQGGLYQSSEFITDKTLTEINEIADSFTVGEKFKDFDFIEKPVNILNPNKIKNGYFINQNTGLWTANDDYYGYEYINIESNTSYTATLTSVTGTLTGLRVCFYTEDLTFISGLVNTSTFTSPLTAKYIRVSIPTTITIKLTKTSDVNIEKDKFGLYIPIQNTYNNFTLNIPDKIYGKINQEYCIYFDNLVNKYANEYDIVVNCEIGKQYDDCFSFIATETGEYTITFAFTKDNTTVIKESTIYIGNDNINKSIIILGDSTTDNQYITQDIITDNSNISSYGTRGTAPYNNEGRSGWQVATYCNYANVGNVINPFYNPTTHTFDAYYYFTNTGVNIPDYFIINLGINDIFNVKTDISFKSAIPNIIANYNKIINSVLGVDQNIKVCVCLTIPPNYSQYAFGHTYGTRQTRNTYKKYNFEFVKTLIETYQNRENERIYLIPLFLNLDTKYNMYLSEVPYNYRNNTGNKLVSTNGVHPSEYGYKQISDSYSGFFANI